jgi:hypothetical protein
MAPSSLRYVFAGQLKRDFALIPNGRALVDVLGGNVIYAASGFGVWEPTSHAGLMARVGEDYPREWINQIAQRGFDIRGIKVLPEAIDLRSFYAYVDMYTRATDDPAAHFTQVHQPFPKALLNYSRPASGYENRSHLSLTSLRQSDIPEDYLGASAAHLCPIDYLTHTLLPAVLRQNGFTTLTLDPSAGSMSPTFWDDIPALVTGLTAFLPNEEELRALFNGRKTDLWEMVEIIAEYGCEFVVVKRWEIPAYPAKVIDPTGVGDAYCGGFLAGYRLTYDPIQAALYGSISASLTIEGSGAFYSLDALTGLAKARLEALKEGVRKV